jgi:L-alanine-DL-glutamate epimerase-like enolase superfamily enzyme
MLIERLETIPFALPFRETYVTARGKLERRELLLVRLHTSGGPVGLGEAAPLSLRGGPTLEQIDRELRETCAPRVEGIKLTMQSLPALIAAVRSREVSGPALAAVDLALHDLAGKIDGEPVWRLLGAPRAVPVRCNATLAAGEPADVAAAAASWVADGFGTLKLKVGLPGDVQQVAAVRAEVGPGPRLRVDANGVWAAAEAIERLDAMARHDIELAEQPAADLSGMARVRRAARMLIAADESVADVADAERAVDLGACDLATVKVAKVGGIVAGLEVAREIPVYLSSALDGPVGIAAAAHLAQLLPPAVPAARLAHGLATGRLFAASVAARGPELEGDALRLPDEPGLGVEIDELALARYRL